MNSQLETCCNEHVQIQYNWFESKGECPLCKVNNDNETEDKLVKKGYTPQQSFVSVYIAYG